MINNLHCHDIAIFTWKGCPYCFVYTTWQWIMFGTSNKIPNKLSELSTVYIMKKKNICTQFFPSLVVSACLFAWLFEFVSNCCFFSSSFSSCSRVNGVHSLVYFLLLYRSFGSVIVVFKDSTQLIEKQNKVLPLGVYLLINKALSIIHPYLPNK